MKLSVILFVSVLAVVYGQYDFRHDVPLLRCELNTDELHSRLGIPFRKSDLLEVKREVDRLAKELYREAVAEGINLNDKIKKWWDHHKEFGK